MNPPGISHRLFVAALAHGGQSAPKHPSPARADRARANPKPRPAASLPSRELLAAARAADWTWSGWQHTML